MINVNFELLTFQPQLQMITPRFSKIKFFFGFISLLFIQGIGYSQTASEQPFGICVDIPIIYNDTSNAASGVFDINSRWANGSVIKVKFNGGSEYVRSKVKYYAVFWEAYANVKFNFSQTESPDVLIGFVQDGTSWSHVGTGCKSLAAQNKSSMNFGWFTDKTKDEEFKRTTLHEFGHALGLLHEHQNPAGHIQWNKPVVRNYYSSIGWSMDQVDRQIFSKYSETLSNHNYDSQSIMHYPIPESFTLDHYSVPWNRDLSPGDIALISELYPKPTVVEPTNPTTSSAIVCTLKDVTVQHNIYKDNVYGMKILVSFAIKNANGKECLAAAYFYDEDGTPLQDQNNKFNTSDNKVGVGKNFTPQYASSVYTDLELFMPYDELHLPDGKSHLKFKLTIWNDKKDVCQSGAYYFNYTKGVVCEDLQVVSAFENENERLAIMPKFTIEYAKDVACTATVYFYYMDGTPLNNEVGFSQSFKPGYQSTTYNYGYYSDLYIYVPYESLNLPEGTYQLKYFVALTQNGKQFGTSEWQTFTYTQY
jgi:hypothetical protein